jgi:hypothetical protein
VALNHNHRSTKTDLPPCYPVTKCAQLDGLTDTTRRLRLTDIERDYISEVFDSHFLNKTIVKHKTAFIGISKGDSKAVEPIFDSLPVTAFDELILLEASSGETDRIPQYWHGTRILKTVHPGIEARVQLQTIRVSANEQMMCRQRR